MLKFARDISSGALVAIGLWITPAAAQDSSQDILRAYNQRFTNIGQQEISNEQKIRDWSAAISQLAADPRLSQTERGELEMSARCAVTQVLDQYFRSTTLENENAYLSVENTLNLDLVISRTLNSAADLYYAEQAAWCLWRRRQAFEVAEEQVGSGNLEQQVGYRRAALATLDQSIEFFELFTSGVERFLPDDPVARMEARVQMSRVYLERAAIIRRTQHPWGNSQELLDSANAYTSETLVILVILSGTTTERWFDLKQMQIVGNLLGGASEQAAGMAMELIDAWVAIGSPRQTAIDHVMPMVEHEVASNPSYQHHLRRMIAERGW